MKKAACRRGADVVYWCIANFPICYSLNIRYTHTHNEYWAGKTKTAPLLGPFVHMQGVSRWNNPSDESVSILEELHLRGELTSTVASDDWFLQNYFKDSRNFVIRTSLLCPCVWCHQEKLARKNKYKKVVLITNYHQVLRTDNQTRLHSFVFIEKSISGKVREENISDKLKTKKIVTRKPANR